MEFRKLSERIDKLEEEINEMNEDIDDLKSKSKNMEHFLESNYVKSKKFKKVKEKLNDLIFQLATK